MIPAGLVLTGGGAKMEGVVELAEEILHMPVRLGSPQGVTGLSEVVSNQIYATGVGLLIYGLRADGPRRHSPLGRGGESLWERIKHWFQGDF
jgi:cell division protein FtsA